MLAPRTSLDFPEIVFGNTIKEIFKEVYDSFKHFSLLSLWLFKELFISVYNHRKNKPSKQIRRVQRGMTQRRAPMVYLVS